MALRRIDDDLPEDWKNLRINRIAAGKLYYVQDGRNAWHSTWVKRWYPASFHFDFDGAKAYAEGLRVQGSVFHIMEVPTLVLGVRTGYALVTELSTQSPLSEYKPIFISGDADTRLESVPFYWRYDRKWAPKYVQAQLIRNPSRFHPRLRHKLQLVMDAFREESLFWQPGKSERAVVRLLGVNTDGEVSRLKRGEVMRSWQSRSLGSQYSLSWLVKERVMNASGIHKIILAAKPYIST